MSPCDCLRTKRDTDIDVCDIDHPELASCAALFSRALAPWEGTNPLAFATEALRQLAAEVSLLESHFSPENQEGLLNEKIIRRVLAGIEGRAKAAAEVADRLGKRHQNPAVATTSEAGNG